MRFGSHKVPLRVMIAVISLACLGVAATIPTQAVEGVDPIITQSIAKVDDADPTMTDLPAETDVAPMDVAPMQVDNPAESEAQAPRQILPQSSDAIMMPERQSAERAVSVETSAPSEVAAVDPVVTPVMSDVQSQPMQNMDGIQPIAGNAVGSSSAIILALDHARVMRMVGDVATVIIGNPAIADVSMPDPQTVVLTGKSYGETNMVMLDAVGNILSEQLLQVTVRGQSLVSVYRGVERTTLSCSPTCEIRPTPGDTPALLEAGLSAFQARNAAALEAANRP
ncbi:MAG: hypothetical protein Rhims3KO_04440 [Hyphomicrobiales bacterium]